jgi:hypothetical protein
MTNATETERPSPKVIDAKTFWRTLGELANVCRDAQHNPCFFCPPHPNWIRISGYVFTKLEYLILNQWRDLYPSLGVWSVTGHRR